MWTEARERLKSLANRALDVVELHLDSDDHFRVEDALHLVGEPQPDASE